MIEYSTRESMYDCIPKNTIGAEIGVCRGANALSLYEIIKPQKLYLVDIWEYNELTYKFHPPELYYNNWEDDVKSLFLDKEGVVIEKRSSSDFFTNLEEELDWVYIDADHRKAGEDLHLSLKSVKVGGFIMMHDFVVHPVAWDTLTIIPVLEAIYSNKVKPVGISNEQFPTILLCKN